MLCGGKERLSLEDLSPPEHEVDGSSQFSRQNRERFLFTVLRFKPGYLLPGPLPFSQEQDSRLREGPLQVGVAHLRALRTEMLAGRGLLPLYEAGVSGRLKALISSRSIPGRSPGSKMLGKSGGGFADPLQG